MIDQTIQIAIATFHTNLLFLQENNPALFEKISSLNLAIEKGYYTERYSLEYTEEGYFDVLETETGKWLYGSDSRKHAELAALSIDFTKQDNLFETFHNFDISKEQSKQISQLGISENSMAGSADLIYYANTYASKKNTTMKKLYKFIFLGTGLGLHITEIHHKLHSFVYLIIEDDLELFRLSLFVTNYRQIGEESTIIFSVFEQDTAFEVTLAQFFEVFFFYNHYIKFFNILSHSDKKLQTIQHFIASMDHLVFNYSPLIISTLRPLEHFRNGYRFLNIKAFSQQNNYLADKPALLLAAGPSFQKNIPWLKENHTKFIIIALSPLLSKLEELGIKPDIIIHLDGFDPALAHIKKIKDISFFDNTIELFGAFTQPKLAAYFKKENIYFIEGTSEFKEGFGRLTSTNIGSFTLALLLYFKVRNIYLLGLDYAPDQTTGDTHSQTHSYSSKKKLEESKLGEAAIFSETVIKVKGNFKEEVFTTLVYNDMKRDCNYIIQALKTADNHIYNFSDGAFINDTIPTTINDRSLGNYPAIDKDTVFHELKSLFDSKSEIYLNASELSAVKHRIRYCDALISILKSHLEMPHPTLDDFHYNLLTMFRNLLAERGDEDIARILLLYFQYVSGYLFDLINTNEIESSKKLIKHINKAIIPQMTRIVEYVKHELQEYVEFEAEKESLEV